MDLVQRSAGNTMDSPAAHAISAWRDRLLKTGAVRRLVQWMDALPRPPLAIEISSDRISAVRFSRTGNVTDFAAEPLAEGMIVPSPVDTNIVDPAGVRAAMSRACSRIHAEKDHAALLLPDPVIRIFVQEFDEFPRSRQEATPLLQWRLKKSLPFEMTDAVLSYVRQASRRGKVDVVTTVARHRVIREYEELVETSGLHPGVVSGSLLSALTLLEKQCPTLIARLTGRSIATAIVDRGSLCGYRCTELAVRSEGLLPQALFEEIYPLAAYYQETWQKKIESVCISGVGSRFSEFVGPIATEFACEVKPLLPDTLPNMNLTGAQRLLEAESDGLVGWMLSLN